MGLGCEDEDEGVKVMSRVMIVVVEMRLSVGMSESVSERMSESVSERMSVRVGITAKTIRRRISVRVRSLY